MITKGEKERLRQMNGHSSMLHCDSVVTFVQRTMREDVSVCPPARRGLRKDQKKRETQFKEKRPPLLSV